MARQNMRQKPYLKNMEAYNDFSGGLNTVATNDNLKDNEFQDLANVDLADRGSAKRRKGMEAAPGHRVTLTWSEFGVKKWSEM